MRLVGFNDQWVREAAATPFRSMRAGAPEATAAKVAGLGLDRGSEPGLQRQANRWSDEDDAARRVG